MRENTMDDVYCDVFLLGCAMDLIKAQTMQRFFQNVKGLNRLPKLQNFIYFTNYNVTSAY